VTITAPNFQTKILNMPLILAPYQICAGANQHGPLPQTMHSPTYVSAQTMKLAVLGCRFIASKRHLCVNFEGDGHDYEGRALA